jgi:hypothetical protein
MISQPTIAEQVLRLSAAYTTSTVACRHGVLISAFCMPGNFCEHCPGLKQLRARDARPVPTPVRGSP